MLRFATCVFGLVAFLASHAPAADGTSRYTMLNVTPHHDVADSHLLQLPGGINVLIDAGKLGDAPGAVLAQLKAKSITAIDLVIISHFHIDHYGALIELVEGGILVKRVALNVPDKASADLEHPWGCDLNHVHATLAALDAHQIPHFTPKVGERLLDTSAADGTPISLEVLSLNNGLDTPVGLTDVNGTNILVRFTHGSTRILFTGDLNHAVGAHLATSDLDLRADILKAPHHGTDGTAPNEFYDRVGAKVVLVPSPMALWQSARSMRTRNYFLDRNIPAYVSGLQGNVTVTMDARGYVIESERGAGGAQSDLTMD